MISERHLPNLCRAHPHASLVHSAPRRYLRLKEMLKQKLVDSGWREDLKSYTMGAPPLHCPHRMLLLRLCTGAAQISSEPRAMSS